MTSPGNTGDDFLLLMMLLSNQRGDHGDRELYQVGVITFEFQVDCEKNCQFYFMAVSRKLLNKDI